MSKDFEKCLYDQIYGYTDSILSQAQCGFRKGCSTQYSIMTMTEKWRHNLDQGGVCGALSTDFDCLVHGFLIATLKAHGFTCESLKLINSYLIDRKHRAKINFSYSSFIDLLIRVPQGSILGPLLFNIYISDLFLFLDDDNVASYADYTAPYSMKENSLQVLNEIKNKARCVFNCFSSNYFKANPKKYHLLLTSNKQVNLNLDNLIIKTSKSEKLLGIIPNTFLNYPKKQDKNYILLHVFQVI